MAEFESLGLSARDDLEILHHSGDFVMLYPQKLASSALFESGFALALVLPCRFFVRTEEDLPYLMQGAARSVHERLDPGLAQVEDVLGHRNVAGAERGPLVRTSSRSNPAQGLGRWAENSSCGRGVRSGLTL